jgi:hypothetical protein
MQERNFGRIYPLPALVIGVDYKVTANLAVADLAVIRENASLSQPLSS